MYSEGDGNTLYNKIRGMNWCDITVGSTFVLHETDLGLIPGFT